jgi:hypothetical protein
MDLSAMGLKEGWSMELAMILRIVSDGRLLCQLCRTFEFCYQLVISLEICG